jgi:hypothetical protein
MTHPFQFALDNVASIASSANTLRLTLTPKVSQALYNHNDTLVTLLHNLQHLHENCKDNISFEVDSALVDFVLSQFWLDKVLTGGEYPLHYLSVVKYIMLLLGSPANLEDKVSLFCENVIKLISNYNSDPEDITGMLYEVNTFIRESGYPQLEETITTRVYEKAGEFDAKVRERFSYTPKYVQRIEETLVGNMPLNWELHWWTGTQQKTFHLSQKQPVVCVKAPRHILDHPDYPKLMVLFLQNHGKSHFPLQGQTVAPWYWVRFDVHTPGEILIDEVQSELYGFIMKNHKLLTFDREFITHILDYLVDAKETLPQLAKMFGACKLFFHTPKSSVHYKGLHHGPAAVYVSFPEHMGMKTGQEIPTGLWKTAYPFHHKDLLPIQPSHS